MRSDRPGWPHRIRRLSPRRIGGPCTGRACARCSRRCVLPDRRVIDALLDLPSHLRERLASALESGLLGPTPTLTTLGSVLGRREGGEDILASLLDLGR